MPRLLEIQRAVNRCLIELDQEAVAPFLADGSAINRLDTYHNTIFFVAFSWARGRQTPPKQDFAA